MDEFAEIQVCTGYEYRGSRLSEFPAEIRVLEQVKPIYKTAAGWQSQTAGIRSYADLPERARDYLKLLSDITETEFSFISTGPDRDDTIVVPGSWIAKTL